ncbi:murein biosynthesis integral membrane protein MurJ [Ectobacillus polymachus]|uniref:murein biosynthesis integral membrane protein MurJ n=1 Tax=Ectobacillus polymachus TaxID=1508806 RepID=UPI003A87B1D0
MEEFSKKQKLFNTVQLLIFFNLLLALIAFIKDIVLASYFGTSETADAFSLAFFLPDMLGNNLIGAAVAVSSIPVFTKLALLGDRFHYDEILQKLGAMLLTGTLILFIFLLLLADPFFHFFHFNTDSTISTVIPYFYIMAPIVLIAPLWLMGSSVLQASSKFVVPALTPIVFNCILLLSLLWCQWAGIPQKLGGEIFSFVTTFATLCACIITWYYVMKRQKIKWSFQSLQMTKNKEIQKLASVFGAYSLILLFSQASLFAERLFASSLETGSIAALTYAYRISQFPLWVFIAAINTFILPTISAHLEKKDFFSLKRDLYMSSFFVIGTAILISLVLVIFSKPLLSIILARGSFTLHSVQLTSDILKGYGLSIVGQSLFVFCTRYYIAKGRMMPPLLIGMLGSCVNIALLFFFVPRFGLIGIGYAVTVASSLSGGWLLIHFIKSLFSVEKRGVSFE